MLLDFSLLSANQAYHILTQSIIPRPIAWVLSENNQAEYNIAPFSYFTAISSNPPILMYSAGQKPTGEYKDSVINVESTQDAVIHIASGELAEQVTASAVTLPNDESELSHLNINLVDFENARLPRIEQCDIAFYCKLHQVVDMGELPMKMMFMEVKHAYVADHISELKENERIKIDASKLDPLARLGGAEYAGITAPFLSNRPK